MNQFDTWINHGGAQIYNKTIPIHCHILKFVKEKITWFLVRPVWDANSCFSESFGYLFENYKENKWIDNFATKEVIHSQNLKHLRMKKVFK